MELLAQLYGVRAVLVEGQVDDGSLRAEAAQCGGEACGLSPALEHQIRAPVVGVVVPLLLDPACDVHPLLGQRDHAESGRGGEPGRGAVGHGDRGGPVVQGEQAGEQADDAGAGDEHAPAPDPVPQVLHAAPDGFGGRMQQGVGADGTHVGQVDAEQRIEVRRQWHEVVVEHVQDVARRVPDREGDEAAGPDFRRAGVGDEPDLHVAQLPHRVRRGRLAVGEEPEPRVEGLAQARVAAPEPAQLGTRRQPAVERLHAEAPLVQLRLGQVHDPRPVRLLDHQGASDRRAIRARYGCSITRVRRTGGWVMAPLQASPGAPRPPRRRWRSRAGGSAAPPRTGPGCPRPCPGPRR